MSSGGQIGGAIVGAVVGFFAYGGPAGAVYGAAVGASLGAALDPPKGPTVEGPRLNDLKIQTSTLGQGIPRFYGTIGVSGNIIWLENNQLKETVRKEKQGGGKGGGGGSQTVKTYSYSATFALCLGEGPVSAIRRIWCSDKLIYNAGSDDLDTIIASNKAVAGMRFYYGTEDQLPDPRIEAEMGVGNAPAYRGRVYIVIDDFALADYSNTLQAAQFKVEVVGVASSEAQVISYTEGEFTSANKAPGKAITDSATRFVIDESSSSIAIVNEFYRQNNVSSYPVSLAGSRVVLPISSSVRTYNYAFNSLDATGFTTPYVTFGNDNSVYSIQLPAGSSTIYFLEPEEEGVVYIAYLGFGGTRVLERYELSTLGAFSLTATQTLSTGAIIFDNGGYIYSFVREGTSGLLEVGKYDATSLSVVSIISVPLGVVGSVETQNNNCWPYAGGILVSVGYDTTGVDFFIYDVESESVSDTFRASQDMLLTSPLFACANSLSGIIGRSHRHVDVGSAHINIVIRLDSQIEGNVSLSSIIQSESSYSSMIDASDIDVSQITDYVKGYVISGGNIRSALEPLQAAYPFDAIQSGYKLKFVPRGNSSVATIDMSDLGATDGDSMVDLLTESREMDTQLPAKTVIKYIDSEREYDQSEQQSERINTQAVNKVERELPIVLTADKAAGVAEVLQGLAWIERNDYSFTLPPTYSFLETSDVITVVDDNATYELLLRSVNYEQSGVLKCSAKLNRAALYTPVAEGGEVPGPDGSIPLTGRSIAVLMDIPVVDETVQNSNGFTAAVTGYTDGWPGALLVRTIDGGQTYTDIQGFADKVTLGTSRDALAASNATIIDGRTLTVDLVSGTLSSITRDQMLSGAHYAAYGVDGRWEICRFQNATLNADGSYAISGFVRGEKGTEWATGLHQDGDWFVLLDDPDNAFIGMASESIGTDFTYRAVTSGDSVDDASNIDFTYQGVNLECLSPVYASGTRDGSANFSGSFTRRSRLTGTWWTTGTPSPVGEATEAYEIDVMNGTTVARTISVTSPSFSYSAAEQATDFGAAQPSITFRIYQLSGIVGRGYPLEVTL